MTGTKQHTNRCLWLLGLALCLPLGACENEPEQPATPKPSVTADDVKQQTNEAARTTGDYIKEKSSDAMNAMQRQLDAWGDKISAWSDSAKDNTSEAWQKTKTTMSEKYDVAKQKFAEMKDASGEAWDKTKQAFDDAMNDLQKAYDDAKASFSDSGEPKPTTPTTGQTPSSNP
ncbi:MAG: hypothetical protein GC162_04295 [Planctomycetes bacterium]|nr:hypothetical protein [Planctomycetota bacterium]